MPRALRERLHECMRVFLAEKHFVGCKGLVVTEEMRLVIAAQACLLELGRPGTPVRHLFPQLHSILVYPTAFIVHQIDEDEYGLVTEGKEELAGETWQATRIIVSWEDVSGSGPGYNVVLHEFAHYLDMEDGLMDGAPALADADAQARWSAAFQQQFEQLQDDLDAGRPTLFDDYAASDPAEFFAVATEVFFEDAADMRQRHPELYARLSSYFRLDPASWPGG